MLLHAEFAERDLARKDISHVFFDFDGTLSWLRHGWPTLMLETFLDFAPAPWRADKEIHATLLADILSLNGKPSIHQLTRCCERAIRAGGKAVSPHEVLELYLQRLGRVVQARKDEIRSGRATSDDFLVCNARHVLETLSDRSKNLIILSGTEEEDVKSEAELLGISSFFGRHIYGAPSRGSFSKKDVIDRILREERMEGHRLLAFGDGPVEIGFAEGVGGLAVGVASDEEVNGSHQMDAIKAEQLFAAGAAVVIPDYAEADALLALIFPS